MQFKKLLFLFLIGVSLNFFGQTKAELKRKTRALQAEIKKLNLSIKENKAEKSRSVALVDDLEKKIKLQTEVIENVNKGLEILDTDISRNTLLVEQKNKELEKLKKEYSALVISSYKNSSTQNKLMYIFSSENFFQAYKRLKYLKLFTKYVDLKADEIKAARKVLVETNSKLIDQKQEQKELLSQQVETQKNLTVAKENQQKILGSLKAKEKKLYANYKKKNNEKRKLDRKIEAIIQREIAEARRKAAEEERKRKEEERKRLAEAGKKEAPKGKVPDKPYEKPDKPEFRGDNFDTRENIKLSQNFASNRGKFSWPVKNGKIVGKFGTRNHPELKGIKIENNGIKIQTNLGSSVKSIFAGKVSSIFVSPSGSYAVLIKHGQYFSLYNNLKSVAIKEGVQIKTGQVIGKIKVDPVEKQSILDFQIWKQKTKLNPELWLYKK